ncbi:Cytoplasmic FMR1-interacting like protein, partial [Aduncisulcus paluster]
MESSVEMSTSPDLSIYFCNGSQLLDTSCKDSVEELSIRSLSTIPEDFCLKNDVNIKQILSTRIKEGESLLYQLYGARTITRVLSNISLGDVEMSLYKLLLPRFQLFLSVAEYQQKLISLIGEYFSVLEDRINTKCPKIQQKKKKNVDDMLKGTLPSDSLTSEVPSILDPECSPNPIILDTLSHSIDILLCLDALKDSKTSISNDLSTFRHAFSSIRYRIETSYEMERNIDFVHKLITEKEKEFPSILDPECSPNPIILDTLSHSIDILLCLDALKDSKTSISNDLSTFRHAFSSIRYRIETSYEMERNIDFVHKLITEKNSISKTLIKKLKPFPYVVSYLAARSCRHILSTIGPILLGVDSDDTGYGEHCQQEHNSTMCFLPPDRVFEATRICGVCTIILEEYNQKGVYPFPADREKLFFILSRLPVIPVICDFCYSPISFVHDYLPTLKGVLIKSKPVSIKNSLVLVHERLLKCISEGERLSMIAGQLEKKGEKEIASFFSHSAVSLSTLLSSHSSAASCLHFIMSSMSSLSMATSLFLLLNASKLTHPASKDHVSRITNGKIIDPSPYERAVRFNFTPTERSSMLHILSLIRSLQHIIAQPLFLKVCLPPSLSFVNLLTQLYIKAAIVSSKSALLLPMVDCSEHFSVDTLVSFGDAIVPVKRNTLPSYNILFLVQACCERACGGIESIYESLRVPISSTGISPSKVSPSKVRHYSFYSDSLSISSLCSDLSSHSFSLLSFLVSHYITPSLISALSHLPSFLHHTCNVGHVFFKELYCEIERKTYFQPSLSLPYVLCNSSNSFGS